MSAEILRARSPLGSRVTPIELFFDLVYVFAVTQLSHLLANHLSLAGAAQTGLVMLAVWWAWNYTTWTTNYLHPDHPHMRLTLIGVMLTGLVMSSALPSAFTTGGAYWFVGGYLALQLGRTVSVIVLARREAVCLVFIRVLAWLLVSAVLWVAGAFYAGTPWQMALWAGAVVVEYTAPWHGYRTPGLGRSMTTDWTIDGAHMAERCQLFIIIALGESLLITGSRLADGLTADGVLAGFVSAFLGSVALWWIYFDRTAEAAAEAIAASDDPGRLGRSAYTFIHLPMIAGIILAAVGDELVLHDPGHHGHGPWWTAATVFGGPLLFLAGHAMFKRAVFGHVPASRIAGMVVLALLIAAAPWMTPLVQTVAATLVVGAVAIADFVQHRRERGSSSH